MFGILGLFSFGYLHEQVHVSIYKDYGINSRVEYFKSFPDMVTYAEKSCPNEFCELAHEINEAVSYPLMALFVLLFFGFFFIINVLEERNELQRDYN